MLQPEIDGKKGKFHDDEFACQSKNDSPALAMNVKNEMEALDIEEEFLSSIEVFKAKSQFEGQGQLTVDIGEEYPSSLEKIEAKSIVQGQDHGHQTVSIGEELLSLEEIKMSEMKSNVQGLDIVDVKEEFLSSLEELAAKSKVQGQDYGYETVAMGEELLSLSELGNIAPLHVKSKVPGLKTEVVEEQFLSSLEELEAISNNHAQKHSLETVATEEELLSLEELGNFEGKLKVPKVLNEKQFKCTLCSYESYHKGHFNKHTETVHMKIAKFTCETCGYRTNYKHHLKNHIAAVHHNVKNFSCHMCEYMAPKKNKIDVHIRNVHFKMKDYSCPSCSFKATSRNKVNLHVQNSHLGLKNFCCTHCDFRTGRKDTLNHHMSAKHLKIKNFPCETCSYRASNASNLKKHNDTVHLKLRDFPCNHCTYKAPSKSYLKTHVSTVHLQLKHLQCETCSFQTGRKADLEFHVRTVHLKIKAFQCHLCKYKASRKKAVKDHLTNVHNISDMEKSELEIPSQS